MKWLPEQLGQQDVCVSHLFAPRAILFRLGEERRIFVHRKVGRPSLVYLGINFTLRWVSWCFKEKPESCVRGHQVTAFIGPRAARLVNWPADRVVITLTVYQTPCTAAWTGWPALRNTSEVNPHTFSACTIYCLSLDILASGSQWFIYPWQQSPCNPHPPPPTHTHCNPSPRENREIFHVFTICVFRQTAPYQHCLQNYTPGVWCSACLNCFA